MSCKWCDGGYYPAVNVNGVVIHQTAPSMVIARIEDDQIVPIDPIYKSGIEICTKRGLILVVK
jgi:hypothetical protein